MILVPATIALPRHHQACYCNFTLKPSIIVNHIVKALYNILPILQGLEMDFFSIKFYRGFCRCTI